MVPPQQGQNYTDFSVSADFSVDDVPDSIETELAEIKKEIHSPNINKPTTLNNIPAKNIGPDQ